MEEEMQSAETTPEGKSTPLPWIVQLAKGSYRRPAFIETADHSKVIAGCFGNQLEPDATSIREAEENAAFITRACNSHYQLVAALNEAFDFLGGVDDAAEIRDTILAALKLAGGQQ